MSIDPSDVIAGLALLLSVYATWRSHRFRKREHEFLELQRSVSALVLEREQREATQSRKADLSANFATLGTKRHILRVFNKGKATAHNARLSFPKGNDLILEDEVEEKFPMETMEPGQAVDLTAAVHMGSKRKLTILLTWQDSTGEERDKVVHPTL